MNSTIRYLATRGVFVLAAGSSLSSVAHEVASHALVSPTSETARQVEALVRGQSSDVSLRYVYGYGPNGPDTCDAPKPSPTRAEDRYGVLVCRSAQPLSAAYYVRPGGNAWASAEDADRRLARIVSHALVPAGDDGAHPSTRSEL
ncbi:hypothetical protein L2Y94_10755 [Luteibacter aegosomatis]|uniref:hypothetical protein n=1 Tax=Luteibacter aegosomatis TaxID=2911537 RepID=UPI001FF99866|nr:hypothetical protein [Luteibacter aegosomatis]UPG83839.1 hypothetical protein L2Y94_10755 [Luteibacter aegosomatis]